jgi:hypothetical protein
MGARSKFGFELVSAQDCLDCRADAVVVVDHKDA